MTKNNGREFRPTKGKVFVRRGVKVPWYEIEVRGKDGKTTKLIAKIVDKFLSDEWEKEEMAI